MKDVEWILVEKRENTRGRTSDILSGKSVVLVRGLLLVGIMQHPCTDLSDPLYLFICAYATAVYT